MDREVLEIVCGTRLFAGLEPQAVPALLQGSAARSHAKGQMLFAQGDPAVTFYIVLDDPDLAFQMLAAMSRHLHSLVNQVEQLQTRSGAQRLAQFLVSLAPVEAGTAVVVLPYDKSLIAHRLGMKPESLSRGFGQLQAEGVTTDGNRVMVADAEALRAYGETGPLRRRQVGN